MKPQVHELPAKVQSLVDGAATLRVRDKKAALAAFQKSVAEGALAKLLMPHGGGNETCPDTSFLTTGGLRDTCTTTFIPATQYLGSSPTVEDDESGAQSGTTDNANRITGYLNLLTQVAGTEVAVPEAGGLRVRMVDAYVHALAAPAPVNHGHVSVFAPIHIDGQFGTWWLSDGPRGWAAASLNLRLRVWDGREECSDVVGFGHASAPLFDGWAPSLNPFPRITENPVLCVPAPKSDGLILIEVSAQLTTFATSGSSVGAIGTFVHWASRAGIHVPRIAVRDCPAIY